MFSLLGTLFGWVLKLIFGRKDPSAADIAASNAVATTELAQEEIARAITDKADAARAAADARSLRRDDGPASAVHSDPADAINQDVDGHYRD